MWTTRLNPIPACTVALAVTMSALAQDGVPLPGRVLDRGLNVVTARPFVVDQYRVIAWPSPGGVPTETALGDTLAIVIGPNSARAANARWHDVISRSNERADSTNTEIRFANGQVFPGNIIASGDQLQWRHKRLGEFNINLEDIRSLRLIEGVEIPKALTSDVIMLANGDQLEGLVMDLTDPLPIEREAEDGTLTTIEVPLERVASIALVNPPTSPSGVRIWLSDGTIFDAEQIRVGDDGYAQFIRPLVSETRELEMAVEYLRGVLFDPRRVVPLASLEAKVDAGSAEGLRAWSPEPIPGRGTWPLDAPELRIDGPSRTSWQLPMPGCTFATTAELPVNAPLGVFDLVVRDGDREIQRTRMDRDNPLVRIVHRLESRELQVELEMSTSGPVHNDLVLHEAILLLPETTD